MSSRGSAESLSDQVICQLKLGRRCFLLCFCHSSTSFYLQNILVPTHSDWSIPIKIFRCFLKIGRVSKLSKPVKVLQSFDRIIWCRFTWLKMSKKSLTKHLTKIFDERGYHLMPRPPTDWAIKTWNSPNLFSLTLFRYDLWLGIDMVAFASAVSLILMAVLKDILMTDFLAFSSYVFWFSWF